MQITSKNSIMSMKRIKLLFVLISLVFAVSSCGDQVHDKQIDFPNDVTFNDGDGIAITPDHLDFLIPDAPYKAAAYHSGEVTMNVKRNADGTHTGFALSNKNYRSYPWSTALPGSAPSAAAVKAAADSSIFSAFTRLPSQLGSFTVVRVEGDYAYFTLDRPRVVEHVLITNTNYNYMLLMYGSVYSARLDAPTQTYQTMDASGDACAVIRNPNLPDASAAKFRVWQMPDPYGFGDGSDFIRLEGHQAIYGEPGYLKITAKGYLGSSQTGESSFYLGIRAGVLPAPQDAWQYIQDAWSPWDLSSLGKVDKVVFHMDSSDKDDDGNMRTPPYFCLDGIRLGN